MNMRPEWVYLGDKAGKAAELTWDQQAYALTERQVLVSSLIHQATRRAIFNLSPEGREWSRIGAACRRERRRLERAGEKLAKLRPDAIGGEQ